MDNENGRPPDPDETPEEIKTVNQIVAWNIAWYRKAAGLRQEEMGARIGGRSKRNVSADERSWDGKHTREFSASDIAAYSAALGLPIGAFFLPPDDDGFGARYLFRPVESEPGTLDMGDLMAMVMPDTEATTIVMEAYRHRLIDAVRRYLGQSWADDLERWMTAMSGGEITDEQANDLRADRDWMLRLAAKFTRGLDAYDKQRAEEGGNEPRPHI